MRANSLRGASASRIAAQLEELGITCEESQWLPEEFVRLSSVQPILKAGLLEQGQCTVKHCLCTAVSVVQSMHFLCLCHPRGPNTAAPAVANTLEWQLIGSLQIAYHLRVLYSRSAGLQVQDEAAGLVVAMLDPQPGEAILDACAAPGGKTLFISARMKNKVWPALLLMDIPLQIHLLFIQLPLVSPCGISCTAVMTSLAQK